jgi:hypothetical protein
MKRVLVIFVVLTMLQLGFYFSNALHQPWMSSRLGTLLWYVLIPGFFPFLFLPVSPEILGRHPSLVIFPILANSYFYTTVFVLAWLAVSKLRKGRVY